LNAVPSSQEAGRRSTTNYFFIRFHCKKEKFLCARGIAAIYAQIANKFASIKRFKREEIMVLKGKNVMELAVILISASQDYKVAAS
jgi:hypothetical protein